MFSNISGIFLAPATIAPGNATAAEPITGAAAYIVPADSVSESARGRGFRRDRVYAYTLR